MNIVCISGPYDSHEEAWEMLEKHYGGEEDLYRVKETEKDKWCIVSNAQYEGVYE